MSRAAAGGWVATDIIGDYQGYVQTDGYGAYERPCSRPGIVQVGCWAHVRRAFKEAADAQGKVSSRSGTARQAVAYIAKLYRIEAELSDYREQDPDRFAAERRAQVEPVLDQMHGWLRQNQVLPGSALGKAIAFALGQWRKLIRYLDHPQLTPDNNSCEQAIRPFVIGRKNWLFSGSPRGAAASALLYSLIETAKANGREPYWYLRELFEKLPLPAPAPTISRSFPPLVHRRHRHRYLGLPPAYCVARRIAELPAHDVTKRTKKSWWNNTGCKPSVAPPAITNGPKKGISCVSIALR